ncbi:MAG: hypothetical protein HC824_09135 [Synechococcales cyanobacterium RM1_1_8]|nr:hypothetical protein [Synechococcales cyanobacterium RM1_1_8]
MADSQERQNYSQQLEEDYANLLAEQGQPVAANRHRREHLSPERQAPYREAAAYDQMIALTEALPRPGEAIDDELLAQLQRNVDRLQVDWAKYTYAQMVARQLILAGQYDAALETLARGPMPEEAELDPDLDQDIDQETDPAEAEAEGEALAAIAPPPHIKHAQNSSSRIRIGYQHFFC